MASAVAVMSARLGSAEIEAALLRVANWPAATRYPNGQYCLALLDRYVICPVWLAVGRGKYLQVGLPERLELLDAAALHYEFG